MEVRSKVLSFLMVVGLAGCTVGEYGDGGGGGGTPDSSAAGGNAATFDSMIKPMTSTCTASTCHGGGVNPNLTTYALLLPRYKMKPGTANIFYNKTDHQGITYWNQQQKDVAKAWVDGLVAE
jgi:hypothetical protein